MIKKLVPWWIEESIPFVESLLRKDMIVYEYGSGRSTIWFAERVKKIYTVEYQEKWKNQVEQWAEKKNLKNIDIVFCEQKPSRPYCQTINRVKEKIDFLIVDGRNRVECYKTALKYLSDKTIVVLDDSQRSKYREVKELLLKDKIEKSWSAPLRDNGKRSKKTSVFYDNEKE